MASITTVDFHVTCECNQECPYCWGPQGFEDPVDTATARAIVRKIAATGARRIVFTGGDPLLRPDIGELVELARSEGLDRLYVMIFPDGSLTVPSGGDYLCYGPFLAVENLEALLASTDFDAPKHQLHSKGWSRTGD